MECTICNLKSCRQLSSCGSEKFDRNQALQDYHEPGTQAVVQAAAHLVDGGRAGTLSRIEEIAEFATERGWKRLGLAYCFGMETEASLVSRFFRSRKFRVEAVSCSTGAFAQDKMNESSTIHKTGCNPLGQAEQIKSAKVDLVIEMGLCLGHDMLLHERMAGIPSTTLVVKDRTTLHDPLKAIKALTVP
jgi:uncharacterized metal-binding protein